MISLAFNLLVIGALIGTAGWRKFGHWHGARGEDFGLMGFSRTLPGDRGEALRKTLKQERANLKPLKRDIDAARLAAAEVLGAETYNRDALKAAIEKIGESERALKVSGLNVFLNAVDQLTPEERRALSEKWKKKRGRGRDKEPDDEKGPPEG
jgi:uncharacterized membrane protein